MYLLDGTQSIRALAKLLMNKSRASSGLGSSHFQEHEYSQCLLLGPKPECLHMVMFFGSQTSRGVVWEIAREARRRMVVVSWLKSMVVWWVLCEGSLLELSLVVFFEPVLFH